MAGKGDTRQAILDRAAELLQERGFNAFSYKDISTHLGIKNAAVHYHFPTKSDLGAALMRRYRERFDAWVAELEVRHAGDPVKKLEGYMAVPLSYLRNGGKVCPIGVVEAEFDAIPEAMREETRAFDARSRAWLANVLEEGRAKGIFHFEGPAADKSLVVTATMQGALQVARAGGIRLFFTALRQIKRDLGVEARVAAG
jgi:TetR/AcrR family transcriptional repressor of nem operon